MPFKITNASIQESAKLNEVDGILGQLVGQITVLGGMVYELQNSEGGGGGVNNFFLLSGSGGAIINTQPSGTVAYSESQDPGQIVVDNDLESLSPAVGTEYTIFTGTNNTVLFQTQKTSGRIQISGTPTNTSNYNVILDNNCMCRFVKMTSTLWVVQGDGLTYAVI
jgi:hypothetical protein